MQRFLKIVRKPPLPESPQGSPTLTGSAESVFVFLCFSFIHGLVRDSQKLTIWPFDIH